MRCRGCKNWDRIASTYDGLGDGLTDGVDLGSLTTTGDTDADVDVGCGQELANRAQFSILLQTRNKSKERLRRTELVGTENEDRLVDLESEKSRLNERKRLSVDLDQTLARLQKREIQ